MLRTGRSGSTNARVPGVTQLENQQRFRVQTEPLKPSTTSALDCGSQAPLHFVPGTSEYGGPLSSSVPGRALCAPDAPKGAEPAGDRPTPPSLQSSRPPLRTKRTARTGPRTSCSFQTTVPSTSSRQAALHAARRCESPILWRCDVLRPARCPGPYLHDICPGAQAPPVERGSAPPGSALGLPRSALVGEFRPRASRSRVLRSGGFRPAQRLRLLVAGRGHRRLPHTAPLVFSSGE